MYPQAQISVLTAPRGEGVFRGNPGVREVIVFDKAKAGTNGSSMWQMAQQLATQRFDVAYSLHRSWRTALLLRLAGIPQRIGFADSKGARLYTELRTRPREVHEVLRNWSLIEHEVKGLFDPCDLALYIDDLPHKSFSTLVERAANFDSDKGPASNERHIPDEDLTEGQGGVSPSASPIIAIAPGSAWRTKRYPAELYHDVVRELVARGMRVAIVGGPAEVEICQSVIQGLRFPDVMDFSGRLSIRETFAVIAASRLLITNDSMALHVASAFRVPTVAIFCATSPAQGFGPWQNRATIVEYEGLWCRPCGRHGRSFCPTGSELCMRGIAPRRVVSAVSNLLGN